jgi:hypothetical protein
MTERSLESVGNAEVELYVELPGGLMSKVRCLERVGGYRTSFDLLLPEKRSLEARLCVVMRLKYSTQIDACALSEREFASFFLSVVDSLSAGKQQKTHPVLWIARGVGQVSQTRDGVWTWREFHVHGQVMRAGPLSWKHFKLRERGWDVAVNTQSIKRMGWFWKGAVESLGCPRESAGSAFTVIRHATVFRNLLKIGRGPGEGTEQQFYRGAGGFCAPINGAEEDIQAELAILHEMGFIP